MKYFRYFYIIIIGLTFCNFITGIAYSGDNKNYEQKTANNSKIIYVSKHNYEEELGFNCVSLINYRCAIECINHIERKLKYRICSRNCKNENFTQQRCE